MVNLARKPTPAESLTILNSHKIGEFEFIKRKPKQLKELVKLTLLDLLLKKVLKAEVHHEPDGLIFKKLKKKMFISRGELFLDVDFKSHENMFKQHFLDYPKAIELSKLAKKLKAEVDWMIPIISSVLISEGYFREEIKKFLFIEKSRKILLTEKGHEAKSMIETLLEEGETQLEDWMENDPARAKAFIMVCGSNIFLLKNIDLIKFAKWNEILSTKEFSDNINDYYDYFWCDLYFLNIERDGSNLDLNLNLNFDFDIDFDFDFDIDFDFDFGFDFDGGD